LAATELTTGEARIIGSTVLSPTDIADKALSKST